jgi:hypothetical protein
MTNHFEFWAHQVQEHMLFIKLGLAGPDAIMLKEEAATLHDLWQQARQTKMATVSDLIEKTFLFQYLIQDYLKEGVWIGYVSFSLIEHMNAELAYFRDKLMDDTLDMEKEVKFWLEHHCTETEAAEKLVDPLEEEVCEKMNEYILKIDVMKRDIRAMRDNVKNMDMEEVLDEYMMLNEEMKEKMEAKEVLTNIAPALINHVIREGEYALAIFDELMV